MDREKVIKAWECCNPFNRECNECPYEKDCYHDGISRHMVADAIVLLKEQEAVYPSWQNGKMYCGHCGSKFPPRVMMKFCHRCGVPIKLKVNDIVEQEGR